MYCISFKRRSFPLYMNFLIIGDRIPISTSKLYTGGDTVDLKFGVDFIHKKYPNSPLILIGYSLGSNLVVKV